ncbi:MAG: hypothetical protein ACNS60_14520 [Candidatus Cyclobacteriaceae bacterium M2_1C_046]
MKIVILFFLLCFTTDPEKPKIVINEDHQITNFQENVNFGPKKILLDNIPSRTRSEIKHVRNGKTLRTIKVKKYPNTLDLTAFKFKEEDNLVITIKYNSYTVMNYILTIYPE